MADAQTTFRLVTVPAARRSLQRLSLPVRKHLISALEVLISNPHHGEQLEGQWRFLRSFHTVFKSTHYRVVYEVDQKRKEIIIHYAATRENFYQKLRQLKLKPVAEPV